MRCLLTHSHCAAISHTCAAVHRYDEGCSLLAAFVRLRNILQKHSAVTWPSWQQASCRGQMDVVVSILYDIVWLADFVLVFVHTALFCVACFYSIAAAASVLCTEESVWLS